MHAARTQKGQNARIFLRQMAQKHIGKLSEADFNQWAKTEVCRQYPTHSIFMFSALN